MIKHSIIHSETWSSIVNKYASNCQQMWNMRSDYRNLQNFGVYQNVWQSWLSSLGLKVLSVNSSLRFFIFIRSSLLFTWRTRPEVLTAHLAGSLRLAAQSLAAEAVKVAVMPAKAISAQTSDFITVPEPSTTHLFIFESSNSSFQFFTSFYFILLNFTLY